MTAFTLRLQQREEIAHGTMAFRFDKPAGFSFKPGQAIDLILSDPAVSGTEGARHAFSIVSAPHEGTLEIATRMRDSAFKNALARLPIGGAVEVDGPFGSLTLHNKLDRAAVFVAGGIGITPFMSMLRQAAHDRLDQRLLLLCSNRRAEDTPFLAELQALERQSDNFRLLARMTDRDGFVDEKAIKQFVGDAAAPIHYLAGPPAMVDAMKALLRGAGVSDADVRSEQFYGY
jgi:ferredoxin-NADP reductase